MNNTKVFITYGLVGIVIVFILSMILGLQDDIYIQKYYKGIWYKDIFKYFEYFFRWVLPYWWLLILGGGLILGIILLIFKSLFKLR